MRRFPILSVSYPILIIRFEVAHRRIRANFFLLSSSIPHTLLDLLQFIAPFTFRHSFNLDRHNISLRSRLYIYTPQLPTESYLHLRAGGGMEWSWRGCSRSFEFDEHDGRHERCSERRILMRSRQNNFGSSMIPMELRWQGKILLCGLLIIAIQSSINSVKASQCS